jgi:hypothetical protein
MPTNSIRAELKGDPSAERYERLHGLVTKQGFERAVMARTSKGFRRLSALRHELRIVRQEVVFC